MNKKTVFLVRNVAPADYGGGEIYQLLLAKKLEAHGFVPVIVTNSRGLLMFAKKAGYEALSPPYSERQNWSGWGNVLLFKYWLFQRRLTGWYKNAIEHYKPIIVNIQSRDDMIAGTRVASSLGVRVVWTDHADFYNWVLWNVNERFKNLIGKRIINLSAEAESVIFVSKTTMVKTDKLIYPKNIKNKIVIRNGVEDRLREYDEIETVKNNFLFVGRIVEEKGISELISAFEMVAMKYSEVRLNVYGDGEDLEKYKSLVRDDERICFHGRTDEPLRALAENEIFVLPSYREGLSLSLLDAAMMGKKIIASDVDGNPEVIEDGKTGLLVPAKNAKKLAEAMIWMLEHKKEADKMAKNARKKYEKEFDFDKIFEEKMLPLYKS